jgi:hypothetical protein
MAFTKLPALEGGPAGCSVCGYNDPVLPLDTRLCAGFGAVNVTRDGESVWEESPYTEWENAPSLQRFEDMAAPDPDHDWQVHFYLPLRETSYQRHAPGKWVLVREGKGFA